METLKWWNYDENLKTIYFLPKIKSRCTKTQVEWLLLNPVNVSFPVTCHSGPPKCPRDRVYNLLGNCKRPSNGLSSTRPFCHNQGLSQESLLFLPTILGRAKGFPISAMCVLQCQDPIPFPHQHSWQFSTLLPLLLAPAQPSICLLQFTLWRLPTIPHFKVQGLSPFLSLSLATLHHSLSCHMLEPWRAGVPMIPLSHL